MAPELKAPDFRRIAEIRREQRTYFLSGETRDPRFRKAMLDRLRAAIKEHESAFLRALYLDLHKSEFEAYSNEIGIVYREIRYAMRHVRRWSRRRSVLPDIHLLPGRARIIREPYGSALIIAPWNYPMQLLFVPLVSAIAAGNTAVVKPSELAPHTAEVTQRTIESVFPGRYLAVVQGGAETSTALIDQGFDYLLFTGSTQVGRSVMERAAQQLTPVTLELGGKSPAIVHASADLALTARKLAWGKFNNAGQTCVAPDYVLADRRIAGELADRLRETVREFYGENPAESDGYGRIINLKHFERLRALLDTESVFHGGRHDAATLYIEPTILYPTSWKEPAMEEEIFGPILPIIPFESLEEALTTIRDRPSPLALYLFTRERAVRKTVMNGVRFGGGGINCTILQITSNRLPFGGIGQSGVGKQHGKAGFDTFSHTKSVLTQPSRIDLPLAYPHKHLGMRILRAIFR